MKRNLGNIDRIIRVLLAGGLITMYFTGILSGILALIGLIIATALVITSLAAYSPLYKVLGVNTCKYSNLT